MISGQRIITWQKKHNELVQSEIEGFLNSIPDPGKLLTVVKESLAVIDRRAATESYDHKPWHLLPLVVCEAISGVLEPAVPASAAIQLFMAAGEVLDDIEDADNPSSLSAKYGSAVATNVATALLLLAETALTRLKRNGVDDNTVVKVAAGVNAYYVQACAGQHLDLSSSPNSPVTEDQYLKIAAMKSATNIECACHIGALLATTRPELIDAFTQFGHNLGMAAQIANDLQGLTEGNDIAERKVTLPVVYALAHTEGEPRHRLELAFAKRPGAATDQLQTQEILFNSGAIHYTMIKMETYKQCAADILSEMADAGLDTETLRFFLEQ